MKMQENQNEAPANLTAEEIKILRILQTMDYGKMIITVKNGKPIYAETQKTNRSRFRRILRDP